MESDFIFHVYEWDDSDTTKPLLNNNLPNGHRPFKTIYNYHP